MFHSHGNYLYYGHAQCFEKRCNLSSIPTEKTERVKRRREKDMCHAITQAILQPPLEGKQGKSYEYEHGQAAL